jgi:hypothetical protein
MTKKIEPKPLAILISDLHLQLNKPVAREPEPDWIVAMLRAFVQLRTLRDRLFLPVICAGDVFDHGKASPELINLALDVLPHMFAIPGQHDLPLHCLGDIKKSAYWTLVKAHKITHLSYGDETCVPTPPGCRELYAYGFPWGTEIVPRKELHSGNEDAVHLAVVHAYCWRKGQGYAGAPKLATAAAWDHRLRGYDVAVFGDNHIPFLDKSTRCTIFNHGCLVRRKSDERHYAPAFGLLMDDGSVTLQPQNVSKDKWLDESVAKNLDNTDSLDDVVREMESLGTDDLDFTTAVRNYARTSCHKGEIRRATMQLIIRLLENAT